MNIVHLLFYEPIFNLLIVLYNLVGNLGLAIIGVALLSKIITYPFTKKQIKSAEKNQEFQKRINEIKKKYKKNEEKLAQEMAKVQAEYLPGQLGGCFNIIITIVLLLQVRNVIINLVNEGVHAFNQEAYVDSLKIPEDSISFELDSDLEEGVYTVDYTVKATNGNILEKQVVIGVDKDGSKNEDELKSDIEAAISGEEFIKKQENEREANIGLFVPQLEDSSIVSLGDKDLTIQAFLRPPSNSMIDYDEVEVAFDSKQLKAEKLTTTEGESFNFDFMGADLARVASDFDFSDVDEVAPYVLIAVAVGVTQFFASKIQMGLRPTVETDNSPKKKKPKKKLSERDPDDVDFAEIMQESSKQMIYIFPLLTIALSLGFMGGATFFPTGVSVFWTGQNTFVIIQQAIMNKDTIVKKINSYRKKD